MAQKPINPAAAKTTALKAKLNPIAAQADKTRKAVGDVVFPVIADKMITSIKQRRASAQAEKSAGY